MAQKPEWAALRNVGGEWFAHQHAGSNPELRFSRRPFEGKDEFKDWDYLKNPTDLSQWEVEQGGSKWTTPGRIPARRKKDAINPDEERLRDEVRKDKLHERTLEVRRVELARQDKPHAYKDIISWEEDRLLAQNPKAPIAEPRPMRKQNTEGRQERMEKETAKEMRSSRNRFFCEPVVDPVRQEKLKAGGLFKPRKASILGNSKDSANVVDSFGAADALSHSVYGGNALNPEWDLQPTQPQALGELSVAPQWFGAAEHVKSQQPAKQPDPPNWWPGKE